MPSANLVSDFGAVGDDSTTAANDTAFTNFLTWARAQVGTVKLKIDGDGAIYRLNTIVRLFEGVPSLVVNMQGATLKPMTSMLRFGCIIGFSQGANMTARIEEVPKGASHFVCLTPAQASRFVVGEAGALADQEFQGSAGFPPNHQRCHYFKVTARNTDTGRVDFWPPSTFKFRRNYPFTKGSGDYDMGGPATAFVMGLGTNHSTFWWSQIVVNGGGPSVPVVYNPNYPTINEQIYLNCRKITLNDCAFHMSVPIPSMNALYNFNRIYTPDFHVEYDKNAPQGRVRGGTQKQAIFQSPLGICRMKGVTFTSKMMGTPRELHLDDCEMPNGLRVGTQGYGTSELLVARGGTIGQEGVAGGIDWNFSTRTDCVNFQHSGPKEGVRYTLTTTPLTWGAKGAGIFLGAVYSGGNIFHLGPLSHVRDVADYSNGLTRNTTELLSYIETLAPAGMPIEEGDQFFIVQHPCLRVAFYDVEGCPEARDLSLAPKFLPLWSYGNRTDAFQISQTIQVWDRLKFLRINVEQADTGANATCPLRMGSHFNTSLFVFNRLTGARETIQWTVNGKIAGERVITPDGVIGAQSGDVLSAPGRHLIFSSIIPALDNAIKDLTGYTAGQKPRFNVEVQTDQLRMAA